MFIFVNNCIFEHMTNKKFSGDWPHSEILPPSLPLPQSGDARTAPVTEIFGYVLNWWVQAWSVCVVSVLDCLTLDNV